MFLTNGETIGSITCLIPLSRDQYFVLSTKNTSIDHLEILSWAITSQTMHSTGWAKQKRKKPRRRKCHLKHDECHESKSELLCHSQIISDLAPYNNLFHTPENTFPRNNIPRERTAYSVRSQSPRKHTHNCSTLHLATQLNSTRGYLGSVECSVKLLKNNADQSRIR